MNKFDFENLDPSGVINIDELNEISFVGGFQDVEDRSITGIISATASVVSAISTTVAVATNFFSCGQFC